MSQPATARGGGGGDIPALTLITKEINNIKGIGDPPSDYGAGPKYRKNTEEKINKALDTTADVNKYAVKVHQKLDEMREALKKTTTKVQEAMMKALNSITYTDNPRDQPVKLLQYVNELAQLEVSKKRLEEAAIKTQITYDNVQNDVIVTKDDIDNIKGYIKSWQQVKKKNYEDEKREDEEARRLKEEEERRKREEEKRKRDEEKERKKREEEERKRREEEERMRAEEEARRKEEEARKIKEEEERQKREEDKRKRDEEKERKKREEEERKRREEEERMRAEQEARRKKEEERMRLEEGERLKREEDERLKRAEEERKKREEEEARRRQLEEEERRKREERERLEGEKRERERLRQKEKDRRRRLDPSNWNNITYTRDSDDADGSRSHHRGVCSVLTAVPGSLAEEDVQCLASDEDRDLLPALVDGEKVLSSMIALESRKGRIHLEAPLRLYVPHQPVPDVGDELVAKVSVGDGEWMMVRTMPLPAKPLTEENIRMAGVELDDFETASVVIVARPRCQNIIVDKPGTSQYSMYDKHVKLFAPREAFKKPTEVKFSVKYIPDEVRATLESGSDCIDPIITTGPLVSLACQAAPEKDIEIDLLRSSDALPADNKAIKGKTYQLVKTNKTGWHIADVAFKGRSKDASITLPALKTHYSVMELEVQQNTPKDEVVKVAGALYDCMNKSVVRVLVKQKAGTPEHVMVQCIRREGINERLNELSNMGYTQGPDTSREFYLFDGQKVRFSFTGNVESAVPGKNELTMPFYAYMDTTKHETVLHVRDKYKQRDMSEYVGNLHCQVLPFARPTPGEPHPAHHPGAGGRSTQHGDTKYELDIEIPVSLPKREHIPLRLKPARVRFPHHWKSLTVFLAWKLTGCDHSEHFDVDWFSVLCELGDSKRTWQSRRNKAKNKCADDSDQSLCRIMLEDWMKTTNAHDDKLRPILHALDRCGVHMLGQECEEIVEYHREKLSDSALLGIADKFSGKPRELGDTLGLQEDATKMCVSDNPSSETLQVNAVLQEWRQSLGAIEHGTNALEYLMSVVSG